MSNKLSLKEALARRDEIPAGHPGLSDFPLVRLLIRGSSLDRPIDIVRLFRSHGLSLKRAHQTLNRIAAGERVAIELNVDDQDRLVLDLSKLGVRAEIIQMPTVDAKAVRESLSLSQAEFAIRFGLELDTIQNWEQRRNKPDLAAQLLLSIIKASPHIVERILTETGHGRRVAKSGGKPFSKQK